MWAVGSEVAAAVEEMGVAATVAATVEAVTAEETAVVVKAAAAKGVEARVAGSVAVETAVETVEVKREAGWVAEVREGVTVAAVMGAVKEVAWVAVMVEVRAAELAAEKAVARVVAWGVEMEEGVKAVEALAAG